MRTRALLTVLAAAAVGGFAVPSQAAGVGATTLYFANEGAAGTSGCTPDYVLDKASTGNPCASIQAGYAGTGNLAKNVYTSVRKAVGFKLSAAQHLTGTINLASYPLVSGTPVNTLPGLEGAQIDIAVNGVTVGSISASGQTVAPNTDFAVPVDLAIPASLNKKVVRSVEVTVAFKTALGLEGVDYSTANGSKLVFPTTK